MRGVPTAYGTCTSQVVPPFALAAVTFTRIVWTRSDDWRRYVFAVAPPMSAQLEPTPFASQSSHW
jgi:hypothetical protein